MSEKLFSEKIWEIRIHEIRGQDFKAPIDRIITLLDSNDGKKLLRDIVPANAKWIVWLEHVRMKKVNCDFTSAGYCNGSVFYLEVLYNGFVPLSAVKTLLIASLANYNLKEGANAFVQPGKRWLDGLISQKSIMVYTGDGFYDSSQPFAAETTNKTPPSRWQLLKNEKIIVDRTQFHSLDVIFSRWGKIYFQRESDKSVIFELKDTDVDLILAHQKTNVPWVKLGFESEYKGKVVIMIVGGAFVRLSTEIAPFYYAVADLTLLHLDGGSALHGGRMGERSIVVCG